MRRQLEYDRLERASEEVIGVLLKMYCFPESKSVREWVIATYEVLHATHRVGLLCKFPTPEQIYRHTYDFNYHLIRPLIDTYIKISRDGYYEDRLRRNFQYKDPTSMISRYFFKVADKLHQDGAMDLNDTERYLRVIGFVNY